MVPNALCPPHPFHQPPERGRQQGRCEDVPGCRGWWVAPEGLRMGGRWCQESHCGRVLHAVPQCLGLGSGCPVLFLTSGWRCVTPGSIALLLALPRPHALALTLPGSHSWLCPPLGLAPPYPLSLNPCRCTQAPGLGWCPPSMIPLEAEPVPGSTWQLQPWWKGLSSPHLWRTERIGLVAWAAGPPPASQSWRFLIVVVYL